MIDNEKSKLLYVISGSSGSGSARLSVEVDAMILMDQVDSAETGVVTQKLLQALGPLIERRPGLLILADSRRGLRGYPPVCLKMNAAELSALTGAPGDLTLAQIQNTAALLARQHERSVFVTLAERGIIGASPDDETVHVPAPPVRGEIDIVGAGDSVTANLATGRGSRPAVTKGRPAKVTRPGAAAR